MGQQDKDAAPPAAPTSLAGQLLVAMPNMRDPNFAGSLICLCAHSEGGAMGLILNQPIPTLSFEGLLRQVGVEPQPPQRVIRLVNGGPVEESRGFVLHSDEWKTEGSLPVEGGYALTASIDILKAIASGGGPRQGVLALGYAGWGAGQLENELLRNDWLCVEADEDLLFGGEDETRWARAMAKLKIDPGLLSGEAGHA
ncbi:YqgE/AlgH family protein [Roseococcus sp. YIM B11640]|uniref:YqgE/AlgH family protein n=1 Tax=Roseococcus sp. YIM B11640 TaxID=3133973 RepID=UPI003C7E8F21